MHRLLIAFLLAHGSIACSSALRDDASEEASTGDNAQFLVDSDGSFEVSSPLEQTQPIVTITLTRAGATPIVVSHAYSPVLSLQLPKLVAGSWTVQVTLSQKNQTALEASAAFDVKPDQFVRIQMRLRGFSGGYGTVGLDVRVLDDETKWRAKAVAPGNFHVCALTEAATVFCWGEAFGDVPTQVVGLPGAPTTIFAGRDSTCAGLSGGGAACWDNSVDAVPSLVSGLPIGEVTDMALGGQQSCAVANGDLYCWAGEIASWTSGSYGALLVEGLGQKVKRVFNAPCNYTPSMCNGMFAVLADGSFASLSIDLFTPPTGAQVPSAATGKVQQVLSAVVDSAGTGFHDWCAAKHTETQTTVECSGGLAAPIVHSSTEAPQGVVVSLYHLLACEAVPTTSTVACWGHAGGSADVDTSGYTYGDAPVSIDDVEGPITTLRTGARHACAINQAGDLFCWGRNDLGQLGVGPTGPRHTNAVLVNRK